MTEKIKPYLGMTGAELKQWRKEQPGEVKERYFTGDDGSMKKAPPRPGWTQQEAAEWAGIHPRTWQRYELDEIEVPLWLIKTMIRYSFSFDEMLDRVFDTPRAKVVAQGGVYEELADE